MLIYGLELPALFVLFFLERLEDVADFGNGVAEHTTYDECNYDDVDAFCIGHRNEIAVANRECGDGAPVEGVDVSRYPVF